MFDPVSAAIMAGASLYGAQKQNKEARRASARQMAFQEDMSNTAYQRAMDDMRLAGLNPILAGKLGGASTPGGATYQPTNVGDATVKGAVQGAQLQGALATAKDLQNKAELSQMNVDWFNRYNKQNPDSPLSPLLLTSKPSNIFWTKFFEKIDSNLSKAKSKKEAERLKKLRINTMIRSDTAGSSPTAKVLRENLKQLPKPKMNIGGYHFYPLSDD